MAVLVADGGLFMIANKALVVDALVEVAVLVALMMLRLIWKFPGLKVHGKTPVTVPSSSVLVDVAVDVDVAEDAAEDVSNEVVRKDGRERIVEPEDPVIAEDAEF